MVEFTKQPANHLLFVKSCKVRELKNQKSLLTWHVSPLCPKASEVDRSIIMLTNALGGDLRSGSAPADPMERALQASIDSIKERLGKGKGKGKQEE